MYEYDENGVSRVPHGDLSGFANTLFSYLYFYLNMQSSFAKTSSHFQEIIGRAVFCIERNSYRFNNDVINQSINTVQKLTLCQEVCRSYPDGDYFRKLYYVTSFILDLAFWRHRHLPSEDLCVGPDLWVRIFRKNFDNKFECNGGWQRFTEAGEEMLKTYNAQSEAFSYCIESFLPNSFMAYTAKIGRIEPNYSEMYQDTLKTFESLEMETDDAEEESEEDEDNSPAQVKKKQEPHPVAPEGDNVPIQEPSEGTSGKSRESIHDTRKRRLDSPTEHSDTETDSKKEFKIEQPVQETVAVASEGNCVPIQEALESTSEKPGESIDGTRKRRLVSPTEHSDTETDSKKEFKVDQTAHVERKQEQFSIASAESNVSIQEPSEGTSEKSGENIERSRKRRHDSPSEHSATCLDSASPKAKIDRK